MPKRLKKVLFKTIDENGNYVTIDMSTGLRKTILQAKQSTTINKPQRKWNVKRKLKPGEQVFTDWRTGKKTVFTPRRAEVKSDNRGEYQKQKDQKTADILHQKHEQEKTTQEGLKNLGAIGKVVSPSTYIGPLANRAIASIQGDKQDRRSIGEQILSGEGTGDTAGNLLLDFASPYGASIVKQMFPDATDEQIMAIYQHMDKVPESAMGKLVKGADIAEDNPFRNYNSGKDIHIKKSKRGTFTKAAKQHGMSVQSFANRVLKNPSKYSAAMRKKANFAHNASKWNK